MYYIVGVAGVLTRHWLIPCSRYDVWTTGKMLSYDGGEDRKMTCSDIIDTAYILSERRNDNRP